MRLIDVGAVLDAVDEGGGGRTEMRAGRAVSGEAASGEAGLFACVYRLATMTFSLAVGRPKNVVL
jgi:hypothetical protein